MISLFTHADVRPYAATHGEPLRKVALRAHVHMLGLAPVLLGLGWLVSASHRPRGLKLAAIVALFGTFTVDMAGQFAAKVCDSAAYVVWVAGLLFGLSLVAAIALILCDTWRPRARGQRAGEAEPGRPGP